MPSLSFNERFKSKVLDGSKRQTVRAPRKTPINPGDKLFLYANMRTKKCEKLMETRRKTTSTIEIKSSSIGVRVAVDGLLLTFAQFQDFSEADGFESITEFLEWFVPKPGDTFIGQVIYW